MKRLTPVIAPILLGLVVTVALAQAAYSVVVNGKPAKLETIEKNGRLFVDAQALGAALGVKVSLDKTKRTLSFTSATPNAPSTDVAGTAQVAGGIGEVGKTYTVQGNNSLINITINKLAYSAGHFIIGNDDYINYDAKYLVMYATVQNPLKDGDTEAGQVFWQIVTSANETVPGEGWYDLKTRQGAGRLKPGQKLEVFSYVRIDNKVSVPKLIIQSGDKVWRYDTAGKIVPLEVYADPASKDGSLALTTVPARLGTIYPAYRSDFRVDRIELSNKPVGGVDVPEGGSLVVVSFTIQGTGPDRLDGLGPVFKLLDTDDQEIESSAVLRADRDANFDLTIPPGRAFSGRAIFALPQGQKPSRLHLGYGPGNSSSSRTLEYDLSNLK